MLRKMLKTRNREFSALLLTAAMATSGVAFEVDNQTPVSKLGDCDTGVLALRDRHGSGCNLLRRTNFASHLWTSENELSLHWGGDNRLGGTADCVETGLEDSLRGQLLVCDRWWLDGQNADRITELSWYWSETPSPATYSQPEGDHYVRYDAWTGVTLTTYEFTKRTRSETVRYLNLTWDFELCDPETDSDFCGKPGASATGGLPD